MGQSSSQLDPVHGDVVNIEDAPTQNSNSTQPNMAAPPKNKKRARVLSSAADHEAAHIDKKLKPLNDHVAKKTAKVGRSVPQHRRGTAIRPSQDVTTQLPGHLVGKVDDAQNGLAVPPRRPQSSSSSEGEFYDASSIVLEDEAGDEYETRLGNARVETARQEAAPAKKTKIGKKVAIEARDNNEDVDIEMDDVLVNPVGKPGPKKRRKKKPVEKAKTDDLPAMTKQPESSRVTANTQPRTSNAAPVTVSAPEHAPPPSRGEEQANPSLSHTQPGEGEFDWKALDRLSEKVREEFHEKYQKEPDPTKKAAIARQLFLYHGLHQPKPVPKNSQVHQSTTNLAQSTAVALPQKKARAKSAKAKQPEPIQTNQEPTLPSPPAAQADRIPTPPTSANQEPQNNEPVAEEVPARVPAVENVDDEAESDDSEYDPQTGDVHVNPTTHIADWLQHPQSPAPPDQVPASFGSPKVGKLKPVKKKRKSTAAEQRDERVDEKIDDGENAEYQPDKADDKSKYEPPPKSKKTKQKKPAQPADETQAITPDAALDIADNEDRGTVKGAWTIAEKATADAIFQSWSKRYSDPSHLRAAFADYKNSIPADMKDEIYQAFPLRPKSAIRKFLKRQYHVCNTGPWTPDEDEKLRELVQRSKRDEDNGEEVEEKKARWVKIGSELQRQPQACMDRWRTVPRYDDKGEIRTGPWSAEEEKELISVVRMVVDTMRYQFESEGNEKTDEELEKLIRWDDVSDDMVPEKRRSAKRCAEKWIVLKKRGVSVARGSDSSDEDEEEGNAALRIPDISLTRPEPDKPLTRKQQLLEKAYQSLGWADVWDALDEIYQATKHNLEKSYPHESSFWSIVGIYVAQNIPDSKFKDKPKLRRKCYYETLEIWGDPMEKREASVMMARNTKAMWVTVWELGLTGEISFERRMGDRKGKGKGKEKEKKADVDAKKKQRPESSRAAAGLANSNARGGNNQLSKEFIDNSDDDDHDDDNEAEPNVSTGLIHPKEYYQNLVSEGSSDMGPESNISDENDDEDLGMVEEGVVDEIPMSSANSRFGAESLRDAGTPRLATRSFLERCKGLVRRGGK